MPRRLLVPILAILALLALLAPVSTSADSATTPPIVIAVEAPITGSTSSTGVDIARGAALAVQQVNAQGGVMGRRVVLVRGDDAGQASRAAVTAREVIASRPIAVIGPYNSSVGLVNLPIYRRARVLPLWLTSSDGTRGAGITLQPMNSQIAPVEFAYAKAIGAQQVAMLVDDTANGAFTKGMAARLRQRLESHGVKVTWTSVKETGEVSAGYYAEKVAAALASAPDLVYSSTYFPEGAEIAKALRAAGPNPACLMGLANVDPGFIAAAGLGASHALRVQRGPGSAAAPLRPQLRPLLRRRFQRPAWRLGSVQLRLRAGPLCGDPPDRLDLIWSAPRCPAGSAKRARSDRLDLDQPQHRLPDHPPVPGDHARRQSRQVHPHRERLRDGPGRCGRKRRWASGVPEWRRPHCGAFSYGYTFAVEEPQQMISPIDSCSLMLFSSSNSAT